MRLSLTERQEQFINAKCREVLYGGAAGGGKSYGQLIDALIYALKYNGSKQLVLRRTYPELEKSLIRVSLMLYPAEIYSYNKSAHVGYFKNGSLIDFGYCDSETDVYKYQSAEYDVIRFDELTHFTEQMYLYLISRLRGANDFPKQVKSTTNPGGVGHQWVKARFIDFARPNTEKDGRVFIPAKVTDNRFLMESDSEYIDRLKLLSDRDQRALLHGDWDLTEGRFFEMWDRDIHVIKPFDTLNGYRFYVSLDYGLDMLAAYVIAMDSLGYAYVIDELYEGKDNGHGGHIVSSAAAAVKRLIGTRPVSHIYAPPDLWNRQRDTGRSIAALFFEAGVRLTRVDNTRRAGWLELKEWLKIITDETGARRARLSIFDCCHNLIRTLPALCYSDDDSMDAAVSPHELTHAPDALRYFVSGRPHHFIPPEAKPAYAFKSERVRPPLPESTKMPKII